MSYPSSNSALRPHIQSGLSTQIVVKVDNTTIGAIQKIRIDQNKELHIHEEIGTEGVVEIHPKGATKITLTVDRIIFDDLRITEAFSCGFINIQAQRIPFDIHIIDTSNGPINYALVHVYHGCWFKTYSTPYDANSFLITESATLTCEKITSFRYGQSAVNGGTRGILYKYDTVERETKVKEICGRLEYAGLITNK